MLQQSKPTYEFGLFLLDAKERLLLKNGQPVPLTPKAFDTLLVLVQNSGHALEKDELMKAVWPDSFVEEVNLAHNISVLRKALGEGEQGNRFIETVPRRGYRFIAPVRERTPDETFTLLEERTRSTMLVEEDVLNASHPAQTIVPTRRRQIVLALCALIVLAALAAYYTSTATKKRTPLGLQVRSIAVLPFKPLVSNTRDEVLELGLADVLIMRLSRISEIAVRPITAVRKYAAVDQDPRAAGRELNVDVVIDGTVHRADQQLRITVRAVRVSDGLTVWADQIDEDIGNIFAVEDKVSQQAATALALHLSGEEKELLTKQHTTSEEAYQLYLTGRYHWNQRTEAAIKRSVECYSRAIANDPNYPEPYSGIADAYTTLGYFSFLAPTECFPKAREAANRALELDPTIAEPHTSLGYVKLYYDWDWAGAEREFRHAISLNPNYPTAHHWYSVYLTAMQRFEEASQEIRRAQQLDPTSLVINTDIGFELYYARRYDEALRQLQTVLDMNKEFPLAHLWLGRVYQQKRMYNDALEEFKNTERGVSGWVVAIAAAGNAYALSGDADEARALLKQLDELSRSKYVTPYGEALIWAGLGDRNQAFSWLNKAIADRSHWLVWLKIDPRRDAIRSDARLDELVRRVGL